MVIREAIEWVDAVKPNAFPEKVKMGWISALEGRVAANVLMLAPMELALPYKHPGDMDAGLLIEPPHDDIYYLWLMARVDEQNGEYDKYQNSSQIFNAHYTDFVRWFADTYAPAQGYDASLQRPLPASLAVGR